MSTNTLLQLSIATLTESTFPKRPKDAHKGNFGHVLVVGGNKGMCGAARLAAEAAARIGAGLISVATRTEHILAITAARPELMCHGIQTGADLTPLLARATVLLIGPGLGRDAWAQALYQHALASPLPKVVDADALNLLSVKPTRQNNWILTPHPGEAGRLLGCSLATIQADRVLAAKQLQECYQGVVVLKGAGSIVQSSCTSYLCAAGNPGMASGGMGDVLGGVIAGLLAQGFELEKAASLGTLLHALAGDKAATEGGERGLLAMDLMPYLRKLVNLL